MTEPGQDPECAADHHRNRWHPDTQPRRSGAGSDADEAAAHLGILITTLANERTSYGTAPIEHDVLLRIVTRDVHVFLHGDGTA